MQSEDKKEALGELLRMAREETPELWEDNFNILLSLIMKNIGDDEVIGNACYIDRSQHTSVLQKLLVVCSKKIFFLQPQRILNISLLMILFVLLTCLCDMAFMMLGEIKY